jgi:hypothetical protein
MEYLYNPKGGIADNVCPPKRLPFRELCEHKGISSDPTPSPFICLLAGTSAHHSLVSYQYYYLSSILSTSFLQLVCCFSNL